MPEVAGGERVPRSWSGECEQVCVFGGECLSGMYVHTYGRSCGACSDGTCTEECGRAVECECSGER